MIKDLPALVRGNSEEVTSPRNERAAVVHIRIVTVRWVSGRTGVTFGIRPERPETQPTPFVSPWQWMKSGKLICFLVMRIFGFFVVSP